MIRCLIVDDQALIRSGLAMILGAQPDLSVVGEAQDGAAALEFCASHEVDAVLMDVRMRVMDGITATERILAQSGANCPKIIALTTFDLDEYALSMLAAGASGFLLKDARAEEIVGAIRAVHEGDAVIAPSTTQRLLPRLLAEPGGQARARGPELQELRERIEELSPRELEVFGLVAQGLNNAEIAEALFVSETTVRTHITRLMAKLEARDRIHAVVLAHRAGVV